MEHLQERVQREFVQMLVSTTGDATAAANRVTRLTLRLMPLKTFIATTMEELFFAGLIGNVQIDNIIPYILRMETAEYNLHMAGQSLPISTPSQATPTSVPVTSTTPDHNSSVLSQLAASNLNGGTNQH
ncbi:hypothetical protein V1264_020753 [Littorina saxatilis]|uniref:NR LBD domain-containing protein n=2 Tax=Littorina saxatilis TaxID=31220 RepID=A0AAN9BC48_9CAEN